jgi:hypothetical protein
MAKAAKDAAARFISPMQETIFNTHTDRIDDFTSKLPFTANCGPLFAYCAATKYCLPEEIVLSLPVWTAPELIGEGCTDTLLRIVASLIAFDSEVTFRCKGKLTGMNFKRIGALIDSGDCLRLHAKIHNILLEVANEMPLDFLVAKPKADKPDPEAIKAEEAAVAAAKAAEEAAHAAEEAAKEAARIAEAAKETAKAIPKPKGRGGRAAK